MRLTSDSPFVRAHARRSWNVALVVLLLAILLFFTLPDDGYQFLRVALPCAYGLIQVDQANRARRGLAPRAGSV